MAEAKKHKILIVDDDEATRSIYVEVFKCRGFEVIEAVDGVEGLDKATKEMPDIIFTGIVMPRMDGFGLMESLKKNVHTGKIPVVISSHMGREEDRQRSVELGAKDFISRDMNTPNEVVDKIKSILNLSNYKIKFSAKELDAPKLAEDLRLDKDFHCKNCGGELILFLRKDGEFIGNMICLQCEKPVD